MKKKLKEPVQRIISTPSDEVKKKFSIKDNIISICSMFVALISLIFTIWQSAKIRDFNKLSVTPKLEFRYYNFEDGNFKVSITNKGNGTAIIDNLKFVSNSNNTYSSNDLQGLFWYKVFRDMRIEDTLFTKAFTHFVFNPGSAISVNEEIEVIGYVANDLNKLDYEKVKSLIPKSKIYIDYHSIYNDKYIDSIKFEEINIAKQINK
jgi:hypothetical protein